jgi:hypothetical protein
MRLAALARIRNVADVAAEPDELFALAFGIELGADVLGVSLAVEQSRLAR